MTEGNADETEIGDTSNGSCQGDQGYPSYMEKIMDQFILIMIITFCGALGFAIAFVFTGTWPEKIKILQTASGGEGVAVVEW